MKNGRLIINKAKYFADDNNTKDITKIISTLVFDNKLDIVASNNIDGDPKFGRKKYLYINYEFDGSNKDILVKEGERIVIPEVIKNIIKTEELKTDIIIPSYNNDKLTANCFKSIKEYTKEGTYRIIWIDNNSDNMELSLKAISGMDFIYIHFLENKGFVGAVNEGLRVSDALTVCLLNNDTVVSERWLEKLLKTLYSNSKYGIIGALTGPPAVKKRYDSHHNIAYQQNAREVPVFPKYKSLSDFNKLIEKQLPGVVGEVDFVAFLCAVIKREVIDKVGLLDTNFAMGLWDDCDWNRSAKKAGYKVGLALDTCIIHYGRSTFKIIEKEGIDTTKLLQINREYLDKKWAKQNV